MVGKVFGNRIGRRPRVFPDTKCADVQSEHDSAKDKKSDSARSIRAGAGSKKEAMGRRVLGEGILRQYGWPTRKRKDDSDLRKKPKESKRL